jgi:hypothetical protein
MKENKDNNQEPELVAERKMKERADRRDKKRRKNMPISGKQVFDLKKIKDEKKDE